MKRPNPTCRRCKVSMKIGKALQNPPHSIPDFADDTGKEDGCTISPDHYRVIMTDCWKCPKCGHSLTIFISILVRKIQSSIVMDVLKIY